MDDDDLLNLVIEQSDAFEAHRLRHFRVWRKTSDGSARELLITICDAGAGEGAHRYSVDVKDAEPTGEDDPPVHSGNAEATVKDALRGVHWNKFDRSVPEGLQS